MFPSLIVTYISVQNSVPLKLTNNMAEFDFLSLCFTIVVGYYNNKEYSIV